MLQELAGSSIASKNPKNTSTPKSSVMPGFLNPNVKLRSGRKGGLNSRRIPLIPTMTVLPILATIQRTLSMAKSDAKANRFPTVRKTKTQKENPTRNEQKPNAENKRGPLHLLRHLAKTRARVLRNPSHPPPLEPAAKDDARARKRRSLTLRVRASLKRGSLAQTPR
jgi:hypothetical protein